MAAKLHAGYLEYLVGEEDVRRRWSQRATLKGTVRDIRKAFDKRNDDRGREEREGRRPRDHQGRRRRRCVTATWSARVPMVYNVSACLDFYVTTAK